MKQKGKGETSVCHHLTLSGETWDHSGCITSIKGLIQAIVASMRCATVSIIGRPSAGKSTLLNTMCSQKISITAPSPQTTRNAVRGILTEERGQLIFTDTPGYHLSEKQLNTRLLDVAHSALSESDCILYVIDASRPFGPEERAILDLIIEARLPVIAAFNKQDKAVDIDARIAEVVALLPELKASAAVSALTEYGIEELKTALFELAEEGPLLYPEDYYTDQDPEFRISEIIREKVVNRVTEELPHAVYIDIADMELDDEKDELWVRAFIIVERESQVGMIVGRKGSGIQAIRKAAQKEVASLFPYSVYLDLRVKAGGKWRKNQRLLDKLIY